MTRLRTTWLVLALSAIALFAVACDGADASDKGGRDSSTGTPPASEQGGEQSGPGGGGSSGGDTGASRGDQPQVDPPNPVIDPNPNQPVQSPANGNDGSVTDGSAGGNGGGSSSGGPGVPGNPSTAPELAPIDALDLMIRESFPPQYALTIQSGLPSGCASYDRTEVTREGDVITVEVWNQVVNDPAVSCTMIYGIHQQVVELGTDFTSGVTYTVRVNGEELTFTAQ